MACEWRVYIACELRKEKPRKGAIMCTFPKTENETIYGDEKKRCVTRGALFGEMEAGRPKAAGFHARCKRGQRRGLPLETTGAAKGH